MLAARVSGTLEYSLARVAGQQSARRFFFCLKPPRARTLDRKSMNAIRPETKRRFEANLVFATVLFSALAFFSAARAGQPPQHGASKAKHAAAPAKEQAMPFRPGETLNYRVSWAAFSNAASLQLTAPERRDLFGWQTWHFRGVAHTLSPVRTLFSVDDEFDSYTDATTLESRQFEMHLNEMGKSLDHVLHLAATGQPSHAPAPIVMVMPGTRDPLGALYALRSVDWKHTPEFRAPVYDGRDVFEMRAQRESTGESVKVAAGTFSAARVSIRVFQSEKEVSAVHFSVWFADDAARTPVSFQADLPFGNLRGELTSSQ
jgi:hypothetical protein